MVTLLYLTDLLLKTVTFVHANNGHQVDCCCFITVFKNIIIIIIITMLSYDMSHNYLELTYSTKKTEARSSLISCCSCYGR